MTRARTTATNFLSFGLPAAFVLVGVEGLLTDDGGSPLRNSEETVGVSDGRIHTPTNKRKKKGKETKERKRAEK